MKSIAVRSGERLKKGRTIRSMTACQVREETPRRERETQTKKTEGEKERRKFHDRIRKGRKGRNKKAMERAPEHPTDPRGNTLRVENRE